MILIKQLKKNNGNINELLEEVINAKITSKEQEVIINKLKKEAYGLYFQSDITILCSNPLTSKLDALGSGIFAYHNNHYYLLENLYNNINLNIKLDCKLLNGDNLLDSFNKKGKILIIQSDDFLKSGEIMLETKYGESRILNIDALKEIIPPFISYEVVILCFINSIKLKEIFKDKTRYLVTFEEINYKELKYKNLIKYNLLSLDFIINFIKYTTELSIEDSFKKSKQKFIDGLKKIKVFKKDNLIDLKIPDNNSSKIKYDAKQFFGTCENKLCFFYPLLNLKNKIKYVLNYYDEILSIIKKIYESKERYININDCNIETEKKIKKYNKKIKIIVTEVMKFFHRHRTFNHLYCIFDSKDMDQFLNYINYLSSDESILILINNNTKLIQNKKDSLEEFKNVKFLIINNDMERETEKGEIIDKEKEKINPNKINLKTNNVLFNDFNSIFNYQFKNDMIDVSSESDESESNESSDSDINS